MTALRVKALRVLLLIRICFFAADYLLLIAFSRNRNHFPPYPFTTYATTTSALP